MTSHCLKPLPVERALLYIEPGPLVLLTTFDGRKNNVMTITWTMATSFSATFAICTGPWNYSYHALLTRRECVLAIPPFSMAETAVRIGDVSGETVDKFGMFDITPLKGERVEAPLIKECLCDIECEVTKYIAEEGIFLLHGLRAWENSAIADRRLIHAFGDGTFAADGEKVDLSRLMVDKLPF